jgi:hypothetical protein
MTDEQNMFEPDLTHGPADLHGGPDIRGYTFSVRANSDMLEVLKEHFPQQGPLYLSMHSKPVITLSSGDTLTSHDDGMTWERRAPWHRHALRALMTPYRALTWLTDWIIERMER